MQPNRKYDYIIAGMGCAGLSLAMQLKKSNVTFTSVLLIDKDLKNKNDRTWCFWTKEKNNWFDGLVFKRWDNFSFKSNTFRKHFALAPYQYMMIRGIDFYNYCLDELRKDQRFEIITDEITEINTLDNIATLKTKSSTFSANYLLNSAFRVIDKKPTHVNYVQHFKGWVINAEEDVFDVERPTFMDFSVEQYNDCRFVYVIPFTKNTALIEYTGFSLTSLNDTVYDTELKNYIKNHLKISAFSILETEKGEIPMVESEFINPYGDKVINIGTAGGSSKPSSGYTFYFIQKNIQDIIKQLETKVSKVITPTRKKRFLLYDKILLTVLDRKQIPASTIFTDLFQKNKTKNLLAFLNEETSISKDIGILNSVSKKQFGSVAIKKLLK